MANLASELFYTLLPLYLANLGTRITEIGLVFTLASVVMLVLQLFGGWLSDTIGRLRTVAIGSAISALGYFGKVLASSWQGAQLWTRFTPRSPFALTAMSVLTATGVAWTKLKLPLSHPQYESSGE